MQSRKRIDVRQNDNSQDISVSDKKVEGTRKSVSDRVFQIFEAVDHSIDMAADHVADSIIDGGRAFIYRLFHPKPKATSTSHKNSNISL